MLGRWTVIKSKRSSADQGPHAHPKPVELENRIAKLEILHHDLRLAYDEQQRTMASLRAQIDHLLARLMGR